MLIADNSGYVVATLSPTIDVETDSFTLACFMQVDSYIGGKGLNLYRNGASYRYAGLTTLGGPSRLSARIRDAFNDQTEVVDSSPPSTGKIFPVVIVHTAGASETLEFFVNGVSIGTDTLDLQSGIHDRISVGGVDDEGVIDTSSDLRVAHVRVWRRALSAAEISDFSNATSKADLDAISSTDLISSVDFISDAAVNSGPSYTETNITYDDVDPLGASLSIDDAGGDDAGYPGEQITINMTGDIGATQGTGTVVMHNAARSYSQSLTVDQWNQGDASSTGNIVVTIPVTGLNGASDHEIDVTTDGGTTATLAPFTLEAKPDFAFVDLSSPVTDDTSILYQMSGTPVTGDQVEHGDSLNTMVNADGTFSQNDPKNFQARLWDESDGTWGQFVTITVQTDTWPFPIDFPSIPVTWEWGSRHPMTQARVRMFKGNS